MTAQAAAELIAAFVLQAIWQAPMLAVAAWFATRVGRPGVRLAYALWVATLLLCVLLPLGSALEGRDAAMRQARERAEVTVSIADVNVSALAGLQPEPLWRRLLRRHFGAREGIHPFAFALPQHAARWLAEAYLLITMLAAMRLLAAFVSTRRLLRRALRNGDDVPAEVFSALRKFCGEDASPAVLLSDAVKGPVLAGSLRPVLLLPSGEVGSMSSDEMEAVIAHELAHLRRGDPVMNGVCALLTVPVAFHPAALWVAGRVRQTREMACDAEAAEQMHSRPVYARALLRVAERAGQGGGGLQGVGLLGFHNRLGLQMVEREGVMEERMRMLITKYPAEKTARRTLRTGLCVTAGSVALLAACMVQVQPMLASEQSVGSTAHAQAQLAEARRELTEAQSGALTPEERNKIATARTAVSAMQRQLAAVDALQTRSDAAGSMHVELDPKVLVQLENLRPQLEALRVQTDAIRAEVRAQMESPEFRAQMEEAKKQAADAAKQINTPEFRAQMEAAKKIDAAAVRKQVDDAMAQRAEFEKQWKNGEIQRQIEAAKRAANEAVQKLRLSGLQDAPKLMAMNDAPSMPAPLAAVGAGQAGDATQHVSSSVMQGNKLESAPPVYPADAKQKHISGQVVLHVIIDKEGHVQSPKVVSSPDESLSKAALDAVSKWVYKPYLLNGVPTAVDSTVNINFSLGS